MNIKENFGKRLRELRTTKGLSQENFALDCELDRTYITSIEKGKRNISIVNIEKIANAFEMSVSEFFNSNLFQVQLASKCYYEMFRALLQHLAFLKNVVLGELLFSIFFHHCCI